MKRNQVLVVAALVAVPSTGSARVSAELEVLRNGQSRSVHVIDEGVLVDFEYSWRVSIDDPLPSERFFTGSPANQEGALTLPSGSTVTVNLQDDLTSDSERNSFSFGAVDDGLFDARIVGQVGIERGFDEVIGVFPFSDRLDSIIRVENVPPSFNEEIPDTQIPFGLVFGLFFTASDPSPVDELTFEWDYESDGVIDQTDIAQTPEERLSVTPEFLSLPSSGELVVTVTVTDDDGGSDTQSIRFTAFAGDYNGDGTVDAADYTVWRDSTGLVGDGLFADGNRDGEVDEADYAIWRENYGNVFSFGASVAVPEPSGLASAIVVTGALGARSRRSRC